MADNLLPCPFCGGSARYSVEGFMFCDCGAAGPVAPIEGEPGMARRDAIAAWNRRPAPMEAVAWREKAQIVTEWLAMARETPKPLHSSLNYVPVSPSEFEALEAILQAMRGA